jgi:hypothetical protein
MTICDFQTGLGQIAHATSQLQAGWASAKTHWNDEASRNYEEAHLREIPARLQLFAAAVQRLAATVERAERECQDEQAGGRATGATLGRGE